MNEVEWWRLKAKDINTMAARDSVVIVPIGSTEQHGPHLPTGVDSLLVSEIARRAARLAQASTPVVVTPTVWCGLAEHHMSLGGTLSMDLAGFLTVVRCICRSLLKQGFRRVLLLNGHGGNITALNAIVNELAVEFNIPLATATYWLLAKDAFAQILERQSTVQHACEAETSMLLAVAPELVEMAQADDVVGPTEEELSAVVGNDAVYRWRSFKARTRHGVLGDPRSATADKGERLLTAAAEAVAATIMNNRLWVLSA